MGQPGSATTFERCLPRPEISRLHHLTDGQVTGRLHRHRHAGGRAGGDDIAGLERHVPAHELDEVGNVENELRGVACLAELAVDLAGELEDVRIGELVGRDQPRAEGRERVERFSAVPLRALFDLRGAFADIVADEVAGDVVERFGARDALAPLANHEGQLDLVVHGRVVGRHDHVVVGPVDRGRRLVEEDGLLGDGGVGLLGVVDVVEAHRHELGRPRYGSTNPCLGELHFGKPTFFTASRTRAMPPSAKKVGSKSLTTEERSKASSSDAQTAGLSVPLSPRRISFMVSPGPYPYH